MPPSPSDPPQAPVAPRGALAAVLSELRSRPFTYGTAVAVTLLGPVAARMIFPAEPLSLVITGGLMLGAFFAFCALANRLFE
jgi:Na+-translocating ferredoxin:NAD+ oxidoreductase RnfD subunit